MKIGTQSARRMEGPVDLGIQGRRAVVCGSSRGLGRACAEALAREGVEVLITGRTAGDVEETAATIIAQGGIARPLVCDVTEAASRDQIMAAMAEIDILVNNSAGPEPKTFLKTSQEDWEEGVAQNMIGALLLTKCVLPGMKDRRFGRIINITSAMVATPRAHMVVSAGSRAGLTAAMKAISLEFARYNVTINNLLPERIDTDRQVFMAEKTATRLGVSYDKARELQVESIAAGRLGRPEEFGAVCAFLCSDLAGYISGQNLHVDGGSYPALL